MAKVLKNRLLLGTLLVVLTGVLVICFTPMLVANGLRFWIWWKARQQNLSVAIERIDAPFLQPVVIRGFHLTSRPKAAFRLEATAARATVALNLKSILLRTRERAIHNLSVDSLRVQVHHDAAGAPISEGGWITLQKLIPDSFRFERFDLRVEHGPTVVLLREVSLSASEIESGHFRVEEVTIASPSIRQTFSRVRGATNWQGNRLTLAGLSLTRGLDIQSITADVSHLGKQRVGLEFDVDAFGGKFRASIANEWRSGRSNWSAAGSATDISLAQTTEAIGFTDRIGGKLHACKFTFRGDPRDATQTTASLWTELTGLTWRNRKAEVLMLGAALYNRQIDLQQLYVKQSKNELTLSGEASFPANSSDWLRPDFRGNISASINNLGDFAALFGANPGDFAGAIAIEGTMNARDRKIGGHLMLGGTSLTLFKTSIDALNAKLNLKAMDLEIEQLELKRKKDFLRAQGRIDMSREHNYSGTLSVATSNLSEYLSIFAGTAAIDPKPTSAEIQAKIEAGIWDTHGVINVPGSSPLGFTAKLPLKIGQNWNSFIGSPINVTLDFPSVFLANAPRCFHTEFFHDGILSGKLSVSETLQHPKVVGDAQLVNGKLQNAPMNLMSVSGRIGFNGDRAVIDFLNAATRNVDLSFRGEIDFHDSSDLTITMSGTAPVFDLTRRDFDCIKQIEFAPIGAMLAPTVEKMSAQGGLFRSDWTITLHERGSGQPPDATRETTRKFPLCVGAEQKLLTLGVPARPKAETGRARKRAKHR